MTPWSEYSKTCGAKVKNAMTAEELKAKRLALGFRFRNVLAKALGVSKYAIEHWEYGSRAIPVGCLVFSNVWKAWQEGQPQDYISRLYQASSLYLEGMLRLTPATDENLYIGTWPQWI